ncbi:MAG TPA: DNA translocase FtsK 4TM domain-containing protein [Hyphomicrobiaceae bacterium]|nr:DNA translocase FtsK 4TM domain-containing protein [Hyphomicrobiaceae bacterium]
MSLEYADSDLPRLLPEPLENTVRNWLARSAGVLSVMAALAGWLCLVSWSIADPSFTRAAAEVPRNLLGPLGASISDVLLQTLGLVAVCALFGPFVWGAELILAGSIPMLRAKLVLYPVAILALAGGASALPTFPGWPLPSGLGGLFGDLVLNLFATAMAAINAELAGRVAGLLLLAGGLGLAVHSVGLSTGNLTGTILSNRARLPGRPKWVRLPQVHSPFSRTGRIEPRLPMGEDVVARRESTAPAWHAGVTAWPFGRRRLPEDSTEDTDAHSFAAAFDEEADDGVREFARRFAPTTAVQAAAGEAPRSPSMAEQPIPVQPSGRDSGGYSRPSVALLRRQSSTRSAQEPVDAALKDNARLLEEVLADFGIKGEVKAINPGPVVTLYEYEPARGIKISRIIGLADDIARSMSAVGVRVAVVPGRNVIGIEVPNAQRETVYLSEIFDSETFRNSSAILPIALGKSIGGEAIVADLARMPHLLVAGTTGSGKSVGINAMILSLLFKLGPERCRLLLIDPKMLELSVYNGIPHLLAPVVTDPDEAVAALNWVVREMEERYKRMAKLSARNIEAFNARLRQARARGEALHRTVQTGFDPDTGGAIFEREALNLEPLPYIVVVVDEFADLMAVAGKEIEGAVQRLAQMARAAGIHLIMATQRPSVDIITGTIKANFPTRISFKVASKVDSRTILNEHGAEQLLGRGDMLYSGGADQVLRVHGAFVSDEEVEAVVRALRQEGEPNYVPGVTETASETITAVNPVDGDDDLYATAVALVRSHGRASISYLQRRLGIGYNRAASLMEQMEEEGVVGPANHLGKREILTPARGRESNR